eukprot:CAMPEP_0195056948 /NCGR_PEP_ID=MMETSP0448-20130528/5180_1 /TAXON_ID=66468 /ORGANISM="Heterocapsa triquestra, Strain CCMP 448" /LENGTH=127 /DNA_ID=CAMNT_0040086843 /DNA_START=73 /DNA_END=456 /DNA_ORIENTATION=-
MVASMPRPPALAKWTGEFTDDSPTEFRRWTAGVCHPESEPVPGLRDVLSRVGLSSYSAAAEAWCVRMGAAFLDELARDEELEALSEELVAGGLSPTVRARLRAALCEPPVPGPSQTPFGLARMQDHA